jgi:hypothetical protein
MPTSALRSTVALWVSMPKISASAHFTLRYAYLRVVQHVARGGLRSAHKQGRAREARHASYVPHSPRDAEPAVRLRLRRNVRSKAEADAAERNRP